MVRRGLLLAGLCLPGVAQAHLVNTGLGPFYDGMGHFLLGIETWLPLVALSLLAGLQGAEAARRVLLAMPLAWLAGAGALAFLGAPEAGARVWTTVLPAALMLALGGLTAAAPRLSLRTINLLSLIVGLVLGAVDGAGLGARPALISLLGGNLLALTLAWCVCLGAAVAVARAGGWRIIALRALASWVAAAGMLLLGWQLRAV